MVNKVVERIKVIVNKLPPEDFDDGFVGIARVKEVESLLHLESTKDVRSIGIWGTGGIGKTTIACRVYSQIKNQFDGACFLQNVRKKLEIGELDSLCKDMLSQLLESHNLRGPLDFSTSSVQRTLQRNKFLIVLDDVTNSPELKSLVKPCKFYGPGSRILLTSRDKQVLKNCDCKEEYIYKVPELNHSEAHRLFEFHAFKQQPYKKKYKELLEEALIYAKGLPLALEVLGCNLYDKNVEEWKNELKKLEENPDRTINDILMMSYIGLDEMQKSIFLDIACVFEGWSKNQVEKILNACELYATSGISHLCNKALITISNGELGMHDLLQQMGQNIVVRECKEKPGRRSRLWRYKDFYAAITQNEVTEKVEVISVDLSRATDMELMPEIFEKMWQLRVLNFYHSEGIKIHLPKGLIFKSDKLTYLCWDSYPLKSLPDRFHPNHLVELKLAESRIVHLWSGEEAPSIPNLKVMDLGFSEDLISLPDFSRCPNLESLNLEHCNKLREIPSSIQRLSELRNLDLNRCRNLTKLPELPPKIMELGLSETGLDQLPSSIGSLFHLLTLGVSFCRKLRSLPESIGELRSLQNLYVDGCSSLTSLPESLGKLQSLWQLRIRGSALRSLPSSLCHLSKLTSLECLTSVSHLNNRGIKPRGVGLVSLSIMDLSNSNLEGLPAGMTHVLPNLKALYLEGCKNLTSIPDLPSSLEYLNARGCTSLQSLGNLFGGDPSSSGDFWFSLVNCTNLDDYSRIRFVADARSTIEANAALARTEFWSINEWCNWEYVRGRIRLGRCCLCIPGGTLPEWVKYRAEGSKVKLKLLGRPLEDFSQLAFCVVVSSFNDVMGSFTISWKCLFVTREFGLLQFESSYNGRSEASFQSEHMLLRYENIRGLLGYDDWYGEGGIRQLHAPIMCSKATFEFRFKYSYYSIPVSILRCGITLVGMNFRDDKEVFIVKDDGSKGHQKGKRPLIIKD